MYVCSLNDHDSPTSSKSLLATRAVLAINDTDLQALKQSWSAMLLLSANLNDGYCALIYFRLLARRPPTALLIEDHQTTACEVIWLVHEKCSKPALDQGQLQHTLAVAPIFMFRATRLQVLTDVELNGLAQVISGVTVVELSGIVPRLACPSGLLTPTATCV
jgi:hypothetical protein